jgi:hypothetical protein
MVAGPVQESNFFPLEVYMYTRVQPKVLPPPVAWSLEQWFMVLGPGDRVRDTLCNIWKGIKAFFRMGMKRDVSPSMG